MLKLKMYKTKIPSDINMVCPAVSDIMSHLNAICEAIQQDIVFEIKVMLNELIINAVKHGNAEDASKYVRITLAVTEENYLLLVIEDEGPGYDYQLFLKSAVCNIESMELCDMKVSGRGLLLVSNLCDKLKFNKKGNRIIILKKLYCDCSN